MLERDFMKLSGSNDNKRRERVIVYWSFSQFQQRHLRKDAGAIPAAFIEKGFDVYLVVGKYDASPIPDVNIIETKNSHEKILSLKAHIRDAKILINLIKKIKPALILAYNRELFFPIIIALSKSYSAIKGISKPVFIMKTDSDGNFRFTNFPKTLKKNL